MGKTLAQLKRDANSGKMSLELVEKYGKTEIPELQRGKRKVVGSKSSGLELLNNNGEISSLFIESSKLMEYTDEYLMIFNPLKRKLGKDESLDDFNLKDIKNHIDKTIYDKKKKGDMILKYKVYFD